MKAADLVVGAQYEDSDYPGEVFVFIRIIEDNIFRGQYDFEEIAGLGGIVCTEDELSTLTERLPTND